MEQRERPSWPIPLGVVVAVAAGYLITQAPLKSSRPTTGFDTPKTREDMLVQARLWQDPIAAADKHAQAESSAEKTIEFQVRNGALRAFETRSARENHHALEKLTEQMKKAVATPASDVTVLLVMVPGGSYVEDTEARIRIRYAVVSALGVACFVPEDSDHIRYFEWKPQTLKVPYEWLRPLKVSQCKGVIPRPRPVLVLWLKEEAFEVQPLQRLSQLMSDVKTGVERAVVEFKTIGPASSTTLGAMLEEAIDDPRRLDSKNQEPVHLYSPWATAKPGLLALSLKDKLLQKDAQKDRTYTWFEERFKAILNQSVHLVYQIGSDDELATALVQELSRRGVMVGQDHIAWISEWDTFYGRALPLEFTAAACVEAEKKNNASAGACTDMDQALNSLVINREPLPKPLTWVHRYSYLRGLDGQIAGEARTERDKESKPGTKPKKNGDKDIQLTIEDLERPEGQSQLDYVHRLVERLDADAEQWKETGNELKAIGVLGSDVYDKLLILQALRKRFPKAIFFTTDLDARLLHPSQYEWTRNVIIVSHFGLQLHPRLQYDIPPFRDNYQTSAFLSVLLALGHLSRDTATADVYTSGGHSFETKDGPRIYEVGRTQAVDLSLNRPGAKTTQACGEKQGPDEINSIHPLQQRLCLWYEKGSGLDEIRHNLKHNNALWSVIAIALAFLLVIPFNPRLATMAYGAALAFAGVLWLFWRFSLHPDGEPFYWFEGVSLWPTELLRLLAAGLCLVFFWQAVRTLRDNREQLTREFALQIQADTPPTGGLLAKSHGWNDWFNPFSWGIRYTQNHLNIVRLWDEYADLSRNWWRRVIPQVVVFWLFGWVLVSRVLAPPFQPYRGSFSYYADKIVLVVSVLALLVLIFFIVDVTRLCERFIRRVAGAYGEEGARHPSIRQDRFYIRLIAERTKVVGRLIDYPFVVLVILIVARMRLFDNWDFPLGLILIWGLSAGYAVVCAIMVSRAAENLRRVAIKSLKEKLFQARDTGDAAQAEQIELVIDEITSEQNGAFAPWTQHPVFRAALLPTGGFGLVTLFEFIGMNP